MTESNEQDTALEQGGLKPPMITVKPAIEYAVEAVGKGIASWPDGTGAGKYPVFGDDGTAFDHDLVTEHFRRGAERFLRAAGLDNEVRIVHRIRETRYTEWQADKPTDERVFAPAPDRIARLLKEIAATKLAEP